VSAPEHAASVPAAVQQLLAVTALHWDLQPPAGAPSQAAPPDICIQIFIRSPQASVAPQCNA